MSLKIITTNKATIVSSEENRLDAKYFFVKSVFDELEKKVPAKLKL